MAWSPSFVPKGTSMAKAASGLTETEVMAEIAERISASLDLNQILQTVVESAVRLVRADVSFIALAGENGDLRVSAVAGGAIADFLGTVIPAGTGMGGRAMRTGEPVVQRDFWE